VGCPLPWLIDRATWTVWDHAVKMCKCWKGIKSKRSVKDCDGERGVCFPAHGHGNGHGELILNVSDGGAR
jgi:hypothetical protein